jgi:hypothetical protein
LHADKLDEKETRGLTPPEKGKGGDLTPREYFINISEKV